MRPNTDRGKSEILFQFRGPGSRAERMRLYEAEQPCLLLEPVSLPPVQLHLVAVYKHLGAQLHFGVKLLQEIKIRGGMMRSAYNKLSKKVFKNPNNMYSSNWIYYYCMPDFVPSPTRPYIMHPRHI